MKIKDIGAFELFVIAAFLLLLWTFFDLQLLRKEVSFARFSNEATQAINQIHNRTIKIEDKLEIPRIPEIKPGDPEKAKIR